MATFKRKVYKRGSSYETTIPMAMLFNLDLEKKHKIVFSYNNELNKWIVEFEEILDNQNNKTKKKVRKK